MKEYKTKIEKIDTNRIKRETLWFSIIFLMLSVICFGNYIGYKQRKDLNKNQQYIIKHIKEDSVLRSKDIIVGKSNIH